MYIFCSFWGNEKRQKSNILHPSGESSEFYYEDELELKLEKPQKSHEEMVVTEEVTLPIKVEKI